jgi:hypothetical protein
VSAPFKSLRSRLWCLLVLLALSAGLTSCQTDTSNEQATAPESMTSAQVAKRRELQQRLLESEANLPAAVIKELEPVSRALVTLEVGNERHQSAALYFCEEPTTDAQCAGIFADDTSHTLESPHTTIAVRRDSTARIVVDAFTVESLDIWWQRPREKPTRVPSPRGVLDLTVLPPQSRLLLIAILKGAGDPLFEKHVWVIETR